MIKNRGISLPENYAVKIARSIPEVEEIRAVWEKMQWHPNSDIDAYLAAFNYRPEMIRPHVIIISRNGNPITILTGRIVDHQFQCKIGYKTFYAPLVKTLTVPYGGLLGENSHEILTILGSELNYSLNQGEAGVVFLEHLRVDSPIYEYLMNGTNIFLHDKVLVTEVHWQMVLPTDIKEFFQPASTQYKHLKKDKIPRKQRRMEENFPNGIKIQHFKEKDHVDKLCKDAETIAVKTYQRGLGVGFADTPEIRRVYNLAAEKQWLRGYILYVNDEPCAFQTGRLYGNTFYADYRGYDRKFEKYSPGTIFFLKVIECLCLEKNVEYYDFGSGDALYKREFGDTHWEDASLYLYPKTLYGLKLSFMRSATSSLSIHGKRLLERYNLLDKVKKRYRDLIRPKENQKSDETKE